MRSPEHDPAGSFTSGRTSSSLSQSDHSSSGSSDSSDTSDESDSTSPEITEEYVPLTKPASAPVESGPTPAAPVAPEGQAGIPAAPVAPDAQDNAPGTVPTAPVAPDAQDNTPSTVPAAPVAPEGQANTPEGQANAPDAQDNTPSTVPAANAVTRYSNAHIELVESSAVHIETNHILPSDHAIQFDPRVQESSAKGDYTPTTIFSNTVRQSKNIHELWIDTAAAQGKLMVDSSNAKIIAETISTLWYKKCLGRSTGKKPKPSILEPTACCGGTILAFINSFMDTDQTDRSFSEVYAIEQNNERCKNLEHNFGVIKRIMGENIQKELRVVRGDYNDDRSVQAFDGIQIDAIFFDPVWYSLFRDEFDRAISDDTEGIKREIKNILRYFGDKQRPRIFAIKLPTEDTLVGKVKSVFAGHFNDQSKYQTVIQKLDKMIVIYVIIDIRLKSNRHQTKKIKITDLEKYTLYTGDGPYTKYELQLKSVKQQIKYDAKIIYNRHLIQKLVQYLNEHPGKIIDSDTYLDLT